MSAQPPQTDTDSEAHRRQLAAYRGMDPARKMAIVMQLTAMADAFALAGLRASHPDATAEELRLRLLVRKHGPALVKAVYGWPADG